MCLWMPTIALAFSNYTVSSLRVRVRSLQLRILHWLFVTFRIGSELMTVAYKTLYMCMMHMCVCLHIYVYVIYIHTYIHTHKCVSLLPTLINIIALPTIYHLSVASPFAPVYSGSGAFLVFWTFHLKYRESIGRQSGRGSHPLLQVQRPLYWLQHLLKMLFFWAGTKFKICAL